MFNFTSQKTTPRSIFGLLAIVWPLCGARVEPPATCGEAFWGSASRLAILLGRRRNDGRSFLCRRCSSAALMDLLGRSSSIKRRLARQRFLLKSLRTCKLFIDVWPQSTCCRRRSGGGAGGGGGGPQCLEETPSHLPIFCNGTQQEGGGMGVWGKWTDPEVAAVVKKMRMKSKKVLVGIFQLLKKSRPKLSIMALSNN